MVNNLSDSVHILIILIMFHELYKTNTKTMIVDYIEMNLSVSEIN